MRAKIYFVMLVGLSIVLGGCATPSEKPNYSQFRTENPRSVLIVPAVNRSVDVNAPDFLLSTITVPIVERGYYVFPVRLVQSSMEENGLNDADMVHQNDPIRLGKLFNADSILYITIERWDAKYAVFATTTTVELSYILKSAKTGELLWKNHQVIVYTPQGNNNNGLAGLIGNMIAAAIEKGSPNYIPLAQQANAHAVYPEKYHKPAGYGLPAGPYDAEYNKDAAIYH